MLLSQLHEHENANFVLGKPENRGSRPQKRTKMSILCSGSPKMGVPKANSAQKPRFCAREDVRGTGKAGIGTVKTRIAIGKRNRGEVYHNRRGVYRNRGLPANHRARQCTLELPGRRIRVRYELQERHTQPSCSRIRHPTPAHRPSDSLITHPAAALRPGGSLIRRRYGGGVGNRCRWADRFAMSEQQPNVAAKKNAHIYY